MRTEYLRNRKEMQEEIVSLRAALHGAMLALHEIPYQTKESCLGQDRLVEIEHSASLLGVNCCESQKASKTERLKEPTERKRLKQLSIALTNHHYSSAPCSNDVNIHNGFQAFAELRTYLQQQEQENGD